MTLGKLLFLPGLDPLSAKLEGKEDRMNMCDVVVYKSPTRVSVLCTASLRSGEKHLTCVECLF